MKNLFLIFLTVLIFLIGCQTNNNSQEQINELKQKYFSELKFEELKYVIAKVLSGDKEANNNNLLNEKDVSYLKNVVFIEKKDLIVHSEYRILNIDRKEILKKYFNKNGQVESEKREILENDNFWAPIIFLTHYYLAKKEFPKKGRIVVNSD